MDRTTRNWFPILHAYWELSRTGVKPAILCPDCDEVRLIVAHDDGEPILKCLRCDKTVVPGLGLLTRIEEEVIAARR